MTKEELEKEAEEYLKKKNYTSGYIGYFASGYCKQSYIDSAEPREKQIQIDAEQIRALQKQNGELTDELKALRESVKNYGAGCYENGLRNGRRKLESQIEKMKCCGNCRHSENDNKTTSICDECFEMCYWELRR